MVIIWDFFKIYDLRQYVSLRVNVNLFRRHTIKIRSSVLDTAVTHLSYKTLVFIQRLQLLFSSPVFRCFGAAADVVT